MCATFFIEQDVIPTAIAKWANIRRGAVNQTLPVYAPHHNSLESASKATRSSTIGIVNPPTAQNTTESIRTIKAINHPIFPCPKM
jgi:hypothetical protein